MLSQNIGKTQFLAKTLSGYGSHAVESQQRRINDNLEIQSGTMLNEISKDDLIEGVESGRLVFRYVNYQRFQDIKLRSKIYNNIFTWYYFKIAERLQWGYMEEAKIILNEKLNDKTINE